MGRLKPDSRKCYYVKYSTYGLGCKQKMTNKILLCFFKDNFISDIHFDYVIISQKKL